ncbi:MAG: hypothetical protein EHM34_05375 [Nitrosopumilales archaeon]|nr:MAG: hypothetical protein EHM34_05375 [Nitrosopumilales archaeon]
MQNDKKSILYFMNKMTQEEFEEIINVTQKIECKFNKIKKPQGHDSLGKLQNMKGIVFDKTI